MTSDPADPLSLNNARFSRSSAQLCISTRVNLQEPGSAPGFLLLKRGFSMAWVGFRPWVCPETPVIVTDAISIKLN